MKSSLVRVALALGAGAALALPVQAGGVRIVCAAGDLNFPDIASAVAAAQEGDVLLVGEGTYGPFTIDGKSLSIWAAPSGALVKLTGAITVRNLAQHQSVVLSGLSVPPSYDYAPPLALRDNLGYVRVQDCRFQGNGDCGENCTVGPGAPGATIVNCPRVAFLRCWLQGGVGGWGFSWSMCYSPYDCDTESDRGGPGLSVTSSRVSLYDCSVLGGKGGDVEYWSSLCCDPGPGGDGLVAFKSEVFGSKSSFWGGPGGSDCGKYGCSYGPSGCGVWVDGQSVVDELDCAIGGGAAKCGPGWLTSLPGTARRLLLTTIVPEFSPIAVELTGLAGDAVWLPRSQAMDHWLYFPVLCVWLIPRPLRMPSTPAANLSTTLMHLAVVRPLEVHPAMTHQEWVLQGMFVHPSEARLSSARHVLCLSLSVAPDCNANGTSDYIDVLFGAAPDLNNNLIPDGCPGG